MVAVIKKGNSLSRSLNYNEKKVELGDAKCIHAVNYAKDLERLNFYDKFRRLEHQATLNENVKANSVHISLNFDPSDRLDIEKLKKIAETYMQKIGFGNQPYLVYQHFDSGHPHIHMVTTNIQKDGRRIDMQNIGRNQSEQARKAIEQLYGLAKAEDHKRSQAFELKINAQKVEYGKSPTKRAIMNVLDRVIDQYKFTSLPELNAILQQYNVLADRGQEGSRTFKNGGLVYRVLDENGQKIGVPIKASDFYSKPTLKNLERKFEKNNILRVGQKQPLKKIIDRIMMEQGKMSIAEFRQELERKGIQTVIRQNEQGLVYGITYIDQRTKCVFNGSDLGKEYSAKRILERCAQGQVLQKSQNQSKPQPKPPTHKQHPEKGKGESSTANSAEQDFGRSYAQSLGMQRAVEILLKTQEQYGGMPFDPKRKKRRKKRTL
jgi:hypothetical protein